MLVHAGESSLVFFRLYNPSKYSITCVSLYFVYPNEASVYLNKLQCFCFDQLYIHSYESVELPVLFYIDGSILRDKIRLDNYIYISYVLFQN